LAYPRSAASGSACVVAPGWRRCMVRFCPVTRHANRSSVAAVGWSVGQDTIELAARLDAELGEHFAQVVLDGARADEQR
jgi:hypothetical protein